MRRIDWWAVALATCTAAILFGVAVLAAGCAPIPLADRPAPPIADRAELSPSGLLIRVQVFQESSAQPSCSLPDAADETRCRFGWVWLQKGQMTSSDDGWEGLTPHGARRACVAAMFSLGPGVTRADVSTCAFTLMYIRFRDLPLDKTEPEAQ